MVLEDVKEWACVYYTYPTMRALSEFDILNNSSITN